mmetsp:Transcript_24019/g.33674  ORF Transcript_24019/g.33674 Transcript_24019/m.33674 type:complete len:97 (-) Transcript_24019:69-359(-)
MNPLENVKLLLSLFGTLITFIMALCGLVFDIPEYMCWIFLYDIGSADQVDCIVILAIDGALFALLIGLACYLFIDHYRNKYELIKEASIEPHGYSQ